MNNSDQYPVYNFAGWSEEKLRDLKRQTQFALDALDLEKMMAYKDKFFSGQRVYGKYKSGKLIFAQL